MRTEIQDFCVLSSAGEIFLLICSRRESYIKLGEWTLIFNPEFYSNKLVRIYNIYKYK